MDVTRMASRCPRCGRSLADDEPEGLCAACLLAAAAGPPPETMAAEAATVLARDTAEAPRSAGASRLADGQTFGDYRIGRLLGRGGMGEVYEAEHTHSGRRLAVKVLRGRLDEADDRARFLREGQLAASVSHPHTVYIFGSEEVAGMPVIAMELLPGGTLKDRVDQRGPLPCPEAVSAVLDIIGGLDAAQAAGILHRDIKPSNCFIDADGTVKVGDFGLSISTLARDVQIGGPGFQGTPQFAPPEQLRGEPLDVRADIYAVGATLYYLLTGRPPFDARDLRELVSRVASEPPTSPRLLRDDVPAGLAAVVLQTLAKDPNQRPSSYAALAEALRPFGAAAITPAPLGLRTAAGLVDALIVGLPLNVFDAWRLTDTAATGGSTSIRFNLWAGVVALVYYLALEATTGASPGKRLFGLRVSGRAHPAGWSRIAVRSLIFCAPSLLTALLVVLVGRRALVEALTARPGLAVLFSVSTFVLLAALFVTVRRRNGHAAVHDLVTDTRVVSTSPPLRRHADAGALWQPPTVGAVGRLRCGPFDLTGDLGAAGQGRLLAGFDPVLRRRVWIHLLPDGSPPVDSARRDLGRVSRPRWLTGRRSPQENWDAYEAPDGRPLLAWRASERRWSVVKTWLMDLANELATASEDSTLPTAALDRIWIRNDGHLVLLDFPAPGVDDTPESRARRRAGEAHPGTASGLLAAAAADVRSVLDGDSAGRTGPPELPLSARSLVWSWSRGQVPALPDARAELVGVIGVPDRVTWWRRAVPVLLASAPTLVLLVGALAALPQFSSAVTPDMMEVYSLLDALDAPPDAGHRPASPDERRAIEVYLAGRHGDVLADDRIWSRPVMQGGLRRYRETAARVAAAYPSVAPEELAAATAIVAPRLETLRARYESSVATTLPRVHELIVIVLMALGVGVALVAGFVSAALVPGGMAMRLLGLAVVRRDGVEIGRGRSILRWAVAWAPALAWLAWIGPAPIERTLSASASPAFAAALVMALLGAGAVWTILRPLRGPVDRLTGTWVVPR